MAVRSNSSEFESGVQMSARRETRFNHFERQGLMSIFGKSPSLVNADDLQELLTEKAVENVRMEFKSEIPDKDETLKKLSSFANTFGGYLVLGARANRDGRLVDLCGVEPKSNYKQTIMQWCFEGADPP